MKKLLIFIPILLIFAILAYILFYPDRPGEQEAAAEPAVVSTTPIVFPVRIQTLPRQDLILWIPCSGLARPAREAEIIAQVGGRLDSLSAFNGKFVRKGELLARLDDATYRLALREAENNLLSSRIEYNIIKAAPTTVVNNRPDRLQKQLDSLRSVYQQAEQAYKNGEMGEEPFRRIRRNYESLLTYRDFDRDDVVANKCGLNRALVEYERAKLNLSYCELRAPFNGFVADCELVSGGSYIQPGYKCMKIVDLSVMNILTEVTESQIGKIRIGHAAEVRFVAYPENVLRGRVTQINPYIDLEKRIGKVTVEVANPGQRIKPGMFANVRIQGSRVCSPTYAFKGMWWRMWWWCRVLRW